MSKIIEETPLPYLTPLSKEMIRALQSVGEEKLVDLVLYEEYQKGASQVSLMAKYSITRNRLDKVIMGTTRPGGSQYQQGLKKESKGKSAHTTSGEATIKPVDIRPRHQKGKAEESHPKRSRTSRAPHKTLVLFRTTKTSQSEISKKSLPPFPLVFT